MKARTKSPDWRVTAYESDDVFLIVNQIGQILNMGLTQEQAKTRYVMERFMEFDPKKMMAIYEVKAKENGVQCVASLIRYKVTSK